jgi:hypothetical protein
VLPIQIVLRRISPRILRHVDDSVRRSFALVVRRLLSETIDNREYLVRCFGDPSAAKRALQTLVSSLLRVEKEGVASDEARRGTSRALPLAAVAVTR